MTGTPAPPFSARAMSDRLEQLLAAHGEPWAHDDHGSSQGWAWRLEGRIFLLYARGQANIDGATWATDLMDRVVAEEHATGGRRVYVAWSFEEIHGYGPAVGMRFINWFADNRSAVNRFLVYTENSILRMTARATSIALPSGSMAFPSSGAEFDRILDDWVARVRERGMRRTGT